MNSLEPCGSQMELQTLQSAYSLQVPSFFATSLGTI